MTIRPLPRLAALAAVALSALGAAGCGGDEPRVALAIDSVTWQDDGRLEVGTECSELVEEPSVEVGDDGIPVITLWGSPRIGTCTTTAVVEVPPGTTKVVDATTSQVVDLPPAP